MTGFVDGQVPHATDFESRFAQYIASGSLSSLVLSILAAPDAATVRAILAVGSATLGGTNGQLLYNNSGVQGGITIGGDATLNPTNGNMTISSNAISNSKMALMNSTTIKSNITGSANAPSDNTLTAILDAAIGNTRGSFLVRKGSAWAAIGPGIDGQFPVSAGAGADPVMGTWLGGALTKTTSMTGKDFNTAKGASIAAAATTDIWANADGNVIHITSGASTITSFGTAPQAGASRTLLFDASVTVNHNAASLMLPGGIPLAFKAGDTATIVADTTTNHICTSVTRANGRGIVAPTSAYVTFWYDGTNTNILSSYNVASVTRNAIGDYTIVYTVGLSQDNYAWSSNGTAQVTTATAKDRYSIRIGMFTPGVGSTDPTTTIGQSVVVFGG